MTATLHPSFPTFIPIAQGKNARLHPIVEERIRLLHVDDIQFDAFIFGGILDVKVEPLGVSFCIEIILQNQIILALSYLLIKTFTLYAA